MSKSRRKESIGEVVSDKMHKTIIVQVTRSVKHRKYGRVVRVANKFKVHDEKNSAKIGDLVKIQETRPISKDKRFRIVAILKKGTLEDKLGLELDAKVE